VCAQVNKEDHLPPLLCSAAKTALAGDASSSKDKDSEQGAEASAWAAGQEPELMNLVADALRCDVKDVVDFELTLFDTQASL